MSETVSSNIQLRVGHYSIGFGDRASRRQTCFTQVLEPGADNPWELDAVLAVTDMAGGQEGVVPGGVVLAALQDCLWLGPSRDDDLAYLIPELISRIDEQLRLATQGVEAGASRTRPALTLVLVKGHRYYAAREGESPIYLLRNNTLRPIGCESGRPHLPPVTGSFTGPQLRGVRPLFYLPEEEPAVLSGALEDGDAIVVSNSDLHLLLGDRDIRLSLLQACSPRPAAVRLAEETRQRGHHYVSVGVLFAGSGPSPAQRVRAAGSIGAPAGAAAVRAPSGGSTARSAPGVMKLVGVGGLLLGGLIGSGLTLTLHPSKPAAIAPPSVALSPEPVRVEVGRPSPVHPSASPPTPSAFPSGPATPVAAQATAVSFVSPTGRAPEPPASLAVVGPVPETPPSHTLAQGMSRKVSLEIRLDAAARSVRLTTNQGVLYTVTAPGGVPAGEPLMLPVPADAPIPDYRSQTELRLLDGSGNPVPAADGAGMMKVLQGPLLLSDLNPGEYRLGWWHPAIGSFQPITTLRLALP